MISKISFGNNINGIDKNNPPKHSDSKKSHAMYDYTLNVPSFMTGDVETFCANKGIKFTKSISKMETVKDKIKEPNPPFIKAEIDAEKFKELLQSQRGTNVYHWGRNYDRGAKEDVKKMMKEDEVPATTLKLRLPAQSWWYNLEDTIETLENKGIEGLKDDQLVISFVTSAPGLDDTNVYTYFAFLEAGMDKIPVYMDEETYKIAQAAGITE